MKYDEATVRKFEVGKIYGGYIVLTRNDETQRITVRRIDHKGMAYGDKMSRKIKVYGFSEKYEEITIRAATMGRICYRGGKYLRATEVA